MHGVAGQQRLAILGYKS